jgi:hypothetical protein
MLTRRQFLEKAVQGVSAGVAITASETWGAGQLAWSKPIGLEMYTVREEYAKNPAGTLRKVGATGYREVEISTEIPAATLKAYLSAANLTAPSTYPDVPKDLESWKKTLDHVHPYGIHYIVVGDNPQLDAEAWKRRAELFNQCGRLAQQAGMQFCYHAHFHEFAPLGDTCGYDIMLANCDPKLACELRSEAAEDGDGRFLGHLRRPEPARLLPKVPGPLSFAPHQGLQAGLPHEYHQLPL